MVSKRLRQEIARLLFLQEERKIVDLNRVCGRCLAPMDLAITKAMDDQAKLVTELLAQEPVEEPPTNQTDEPTGSRFSWLETD